MIVKLSSTNRLFVPHVIAQAAGSEAYRTDPDFHTSVIREEKDIGGTLHTEFMALM